MGTRDRKRAARRRRVAKEARAGYAADTAELPRPLRLAVESADELRRYVDAAQSSEEAAAAARGKVVSAAVRLAELTAPYDAFDVLENVRLSQLIANPETYRETEHEGKTSTIEVVAAVLAARGGRAPTAEPPAKDAEDGGHAGHARGARPRPDRVMDEVLRLAEEITDAGMILGLFTAMAEPDAFSGIGLGAQMREIGVRNLSYPHMVDETLGALFPSGPVSDHVRRLLGCDVADIRAVFGALGELHHAALEARTEIMRQLHAMWQETASCEKPFTDETRARGRALWAEIWDRMADCSIVSDDDLARAAGVSADVVWAVRRAFSTPMTAQQPGDAALGFLTGRNPFRTRPLLADPGGETVAVHGALLTPSIRERVEEALKTDSKAWAAYDKHRAALLESAALDLLARHLPGAQRHAGLQYLVPSTDAQKEPSQYTKLAETDGLLVADDVAVVVEGKAGALRPHSRAGDRQGLERDLRGLVTSAAAQAARVRERILADGGLRLRGGSWLDLSGVREVHTVAVTLDDLSGIATVTSQLVNAGLLTGEDLPWTVSLHDLRIISELVDRPAELVLYLRRRTEPEVTRFFHAVDELDFFLEFYATGLYVEPDPDAVAAALPTLPPPRVRDRRRRAAQGLTMLMSRTGPLDDWYFHRLGLRQTPAPKPAHNANAGLAALVDALAFGQQPGWLSTGATLLEGDSATQRKWSGYGPALATRTRADGRGHSITVHGGTRPENAFVLAWVSRPASQTVADARQRLAAYVSAKKHQLRAARGFGMLYSPTGDLEATVFDKRPPGPDAALDLMAQGLRPVESMRALPPPPRRKPGGGK